MQKPLVDSRYRADCLWLALVLTLLDFFLFRFAPLAYILSTLALIQSRFSTLIQYNFFATDSAPKFDIAALDLGQYLAAKSVPSATLISFDSGRQTHFCFSPGICPKVLF
ncbi:hypothetical protein M9H77_30918 [Catharanthus roseus]|uniref:Uncharacterized protein n=1 Tax=Catharanthus roseus TaxID=4058 RepID=A0ACC0A2I9_CATRO|nr:hypothetical protein M9H77_30918 [Catharanthus roseus]